MRTSTCLLPKVLFTIALGLALTTAQPRSAFAQGDGVVPASYQTGNFFNRQLGTSFRFNYHTQGYGTQDDVFSLGAMKNFNLDDAVVFLDGQGTLSDDFGGGFNLGVGYRQLTTLAMNYDAERILGVGFWTDGQSTASDNFFTQLGFSLESLGESYDLRLNGHFPLERTEEGDAVLTGTGVPFYAGNNIFGATESLTIDTAHTVVDGEFAKRISDLEAWAFAGGYHIGGGGVDTTGYRLGVRGYAVPDLALSLQVTDDNVYATNVMFGATWFIGRTTKANAPCGTIVDRFREPTLRNDFIATTSERVTRASGSALTDNATNDTIRVVHVNSAAAAGGDGSFENPYDQISDSNVLLAGQAGNSLEGDIILVHAGSTFAGADGQAVLQDNQSLFGEGLDHNGNAINHVLDTNELGLINMPETATGSQALARAVITAGGLDTFTLADNNAVNNFTINGAGTAVTASPDDLGTDPNDTLVTPELANLQINDAATGVFLDRVSGTGIVENTVEINRATVAGVNVTGGQDGLSIGAVINDSTGNSLMVQNRTGGTVNFTGTVDDDVDNSGDNSDGILIANNQDTTVNMSNTLKLHVNDGETGLLISNNSATSTSNSSIVNASGVVDITATGTGQAVAVNGNDENTAMAIVDLNATAVTGNTVDVRGGGTMAIGSADNTRVIANTGTGTAVFNQGNLANADDNGELTVNSNITNAGGGLAVQIENRLEKDATFTGDITVAGGTAAGVLVQNNEDGNILFTGKLDLDTGVNNAITLTNNENAGNNTAATISFADLDLETTTGGAFIASGGGNLIATSANNTNNILVTGAGRGLSLDGMTIDTAGVRFDKIDVNNSGIVGINLKDLEGTGQVNLGGGTNPADGGTLTTAGTAIVVDNAENVLITNMTVSNIGTAGGVSVTNQIAGSNATFAGLDVNTINADAVNVSSNTDGTIAFTELTAATTGTGGAVVLNNNADATVSVNGMTASATGTGVGFRATGTGNLTVAGDTSVTTATGQAVEIDGQTIVGAAGFDTVTATGATNGVTLKDVTGATVTIGSGTNPGDGGTLQTTGTAITVDNVAQVAINRVLVDNDAGGNIGAGLSVTNQTAGSTFASSELEVRTTTADAVTVNGNTGGTIAFTDVETQTTDGTGITVTNNGTATTTFNGMEVTATGTGAGFAASGSGTLVATGTNNITTATGTGLDINGTTIGGAGASFNSVTTNGSTNGVVLNDATGGRVRVGAASATGTDGAGGTLNTTDTAILVTGTTNAVFNDVTINSDTNDAVIVNHTLATTSDILFDNLSITTAAAAGNGVVINDNGTGELDVILRNSEINATASDTIAFLVNAGNNTGRVDVTVQGNTLTTGDSQALLADIDQGSGDVQFLLNNGNAITNNSATDAAADFSLTAARNLNASIGKQDDAGPFDSNSFTNGNAAGTAFLATVNNAAADFNLDLRGNQASGGTLDFSLSETNGDFGVVDTADTITGGILNIGTFDLDGGVVGDFDDLAPPIQQVD